MNWFKPLAGGVIVSAQAMNPASPLVDPRILSLLAQAAELGGAVGFRVDGADVVRDLRASTSRSIMGIKKDDTAGSETYITPSVHTAHELIDAGADIIAAQATNGHRPADSFAEVVGACHARGVPVVADIASLEEGQAAVRAGADAVATTMVGFTSGTLNHRRPALELTRRLRKLVAVPVISEGGIWTPEHVRESFAAGAGAVVVGSAVTAPDLITARLAAAAPRHQAMQHST